MWRTAHYLRANSKHSQSDSFGMKELYLLHRKRLLTSPYFASHCVSGWPPNEEHQWKSSYCTFMLPTGWHAPQPGQSLWATTAKLAAPTQSFCLLQKLTSHLTEKVKHGTYVTARISHNPHTDGTAKIKLCLFATRYKNSLIALTYWK